MANDFLRKCIADAVDECQMKMSEMESRLLYGTAKEAEVYNTTFTPTTTSYTTTRPTFPQISDSLLEGYKKQMQENIFSGSPLLEAMKNKEKKMDNKELIHERVAERKKAKIDAILDDLSWMIDEDWMDGDTIKWTVTFFGNDTTYHYAAVRAKNAWYTTDRIKSSPISTDEIIERLIEADLDGGRFTVPVRV